MRRKPRATINERRWTLAMNDAKYLQDVTTSEAAEHLLHFNGYPEDDSNGLIEQCERETFIDYDDEVDGAHWDFIVHTPIYQGIQRGWKLQSHGFATQDEAYAYFCSPPVYDAFRHWLGIKTTNFKPLEIGAAREYWKNLSDEELEAFYHRYTESKPRYYIGVDENTSYEDYLVLSARQSEYERRMDI